MIVQNFVYKCICVQLVYYVRCGYFKDYKVCIYIVYVKINIIVFLILFGFMFFKNKCRKYIELKKGIYDFWIIVIKKEKFLGIELIIVKIY